MWFSPSKLLWWFIGDKNGILLRTVTVFKLPKFYDLMLLLLRETLAEL